MNPDPRFFLAKQERINSRFCQAPHSRQEYRPLFQVSDFPTVVPRVLSLKQHLLFWSLKPRVPDMMCDSKCTA